MEDNDLPKVRNQDTDPAYNREPGIIVAPGSPLQTEMAKFEQFPHSQWAFGQPGNPYKYRPFPKMVYRAALLSGKVMCQVPPPDRYEYRDDRAFLMAEESARRFSEKNTQIVRDEAEYSRAMESGWRETPQEAIAFVEHRENQRSQAIAELNYEDRNLSPAAKAEKAAHVAEVGEPVPEVPESRRARRAR